MNNLKTLRAGLVGSGFAAAFHVEALRRVFSTRVEIVGVYSPTVDKRRAFAKRYEIEPFDSLDGLIDTVDVVHVCTPPSTHEEVAVRTLEAGKHVIIEKPYTGYFGDDSPEFDGDTFPRSVGLEKAIASVARIAAAERQSPGYVSYAENWIYAPAVQKEREIIEKTDAQILWIHGEEAHSGSHSPYYGIWRYAGGGSIVGKGVHPLSTALYLKQVEGRVRHGRPIRPASVSARVHAITRMPGFKNSGHLRENYTDIEDFGALHVVFDDGTIADIFASDLVHGGVHNWIEINADNHRTICNINPNTAMQTYNPIDAQFENIYTVEKTGTKQGWSFPSPDEDWFHGYQHEMDAFYRGISLGTEPESGSLIGGDTIAVVYSGYLSAERKGTEVAVPIGEGT